MKVLLSVPMSRFSGYGNDGIGLALALIRRGVDVYVRPTVVQAPVPQEIADLLTKEVRAPFDLSISHVDPAALELLPDTKAATAFNIGWSMWEYTSLSFMKGRSSLRRRLKDFDALVGYDDVTVDCFRPYYSGPLLKQQGGFEPDKWEYLERDWNEEDFYFSLVGAPLSIRKNPFAAIGAFGELKNEDPLFDKHARLMLKTSSDDGRLHPKMEDVYPGLRIFCDTWDTETLLEFYAKTHVLLAPSRGEGKHMPSLEFQSTGGPVIGTNWGGIAEWISPEYGYPLPYKLEPQSIYDPRCVNATVDKDALKKAMLHCFYNRAEVKQKGLIASSVIPKMLAWESVVDNLMLKLSTVPRGEAVYEKYVAARSSEDRHGDV